MCGRYGLISGEKEIKNRFDIKEFKGEVSRNYNLAPTQKAPIIEKHSPNSMRVMKWGFQPEWSTRMLINAQAEKLSESRVWSKAFRQSRCIVPADYFFEWKSIENKRQPYLIKMKNEEIMGFAGIILTNKKESIEEENFVIITTEPNEMMSSIHNRMPAILKKENEDEWLNPDNTEDDKLLNLLNPVLSENMTSYKVGLAVSSPKNNDSSILSPIKKLL